MEEFHFHSFHHTIVNFVAPQGQFVETHDHTLAKGRIFVGEVLVLGCQAVISGSQLLDGAVPGLDKRLRFWSDQVFGFVFEAVCLSRILSRDEIVVNVDAFSL